MLLNRIFKLTDDNHILHKDLTGTAMTPDQVGKGWRADLIKLCRERNAAGLAANQLGVPMNFFFVAASVRMTGMPVPQLCLNPSWTPVGECGRTRMREGCKSLPDEYHVVRWHCIDATWTDTLGKVQNRRLKGYGAEVYQHEHDHLRGLTLVETGSRI